MPRFVVFGDRSIDTENVSDGTKGKDSKGEEGTHLMFWEIRTLKVEGTVAEVVAKLEGKTP